MAERGLPIGDLAADWIWQDVTKLAADLRTAKVAEQLYNAVCDIGATFSEGYSRGSGRDRCRFYEYALGSARESRDWTYKARVVIGPERTELFLGLLTRIVQLLTVIIGRERHRDLRGRKGQLSHADA